MTFEAVKQQEQQNIMPVYSRFQVALVSGKGATATDVNGKQYIDFTSGIGVNSLGFCDPEWSAAVAKQAGTLQHISNLYYSPVQTAAAENLCRLSGMSKVFFANSGAEANECAVKLARKYGTDRLGPGRTEIVTLKNSFHGRTVTTLAATGQNEFHEYFAPLTTGFSYAEPNLRSVKDAVTEKTCAVMLELIQGEGGVVPMDKAFVEELRAFCTQRKILMIVDEVQTGVGRTGTFYSYRNYGVVPDVVTSAKGLASGLPLGACLCAEPFADVLGPGTHGSTFGGNPIACAGALVVMKRLAEPEFLKDVREKGNYFAEKLAEMHGVSSVRGMGLMLGAKPAHGSVGEIAVKCAERGLLILTAKDVLRLLPPLVISKDEADKGLAILREVLDTYEP
ncbi:aspartate aminotransferase family protein [Caproicibacter fermentans]|uniref:Acetylornithine aminotransferase n=1 Tax=Caproicibacter fermentans TaxID=2576756 RepID=A0A7G8T6Q2_9FIRM|nr:aspartate aminotransferase family protein [Caproicibacter fermentans]QNK39293.1 aspartate aminotransferase family protein [Caproicibacter fermentans]